MNHSYKNVLLSILTAGTIFSTIATPVLAVDSTRSAKSPAAENRCKIATERIDTVIARYNNNKAQYLKRYAQLAEKIKAILDKLDSKGYDTSKARTDYQTINQKITKAGQDYQVFIDKLTATNQFVCGQSQGDFVKARQDAQALLKIVKQDTLDIRNFYQTTLRPDLKALQNQKPAPSATPIPVNQ